ncbi:MAG: O-antigen ligase family protein [Calditrichaeota bacterium]|nr:MAG: O-antigen ligase family protein [Calditrichota bacterium]
MIAVARQHDRTLDKKSLALFIVFNACFLASFFIVPNAFALLLAMTGLLGISFFVLAIENFVESILLLTYVFSLGLVYTHLGLFPLLGGLFLITMVSVIRSLAQGVLHWKHISFAVSLSLFIFMAGLSLFWGSPFMGGYRLFGLNLIGGLFIFLIAHFSVVSFRSLSFLTIFVIFIITMNGIYGIYDHLTVGGRAVSFIANTPTYSGHFFVQGIALIACVSKLPEMKKARGLFGLAFLILVIALFFTLTRAAWLAIIFYFFIHTLFFKIRLHKVFIATALFIVVIITIFMVLGSQAFTAMLFQRLLVDYQHVGQSYGSIAFRLLLWQSAWFIFKTNPVLGVGFDNFVSANSGTPNYAIIQGLGGDNLYAHNVYLQIMAEMGLIGISVFTFFLYSIYKKCRSILLTMKTHKYRPLAVGYISVLLLWLFMALSEAALYTPLTSAFFFFILGIVSGINKNLEFNNQNEIVFV